MKKTAAITLATALTAVVGGSVLPVTASADGFGPMNMMNPSKWFNRNRRDYDDYYDDGPGYGPPPGYGAPPAYGYGAPPGGYAPAPAAAYPAQPAPGYGAPAVSTTASPDDDAQQRIRDLEERIRQLESRQQYPAPNAGAPNYGMQQPSQQPATPGYGVQQPAQPSVMPSYGGAVQQPQPGTPVFRPSN